MRANIKEMLPPSILSMRRCLVRLNISCCCIWPVDAMTKGMTNPTMRWGKKKKRKRKRQQRNESRDVFSMFFEFSDILHKCFLMRHAGILAVTQNTNISQSEFDKALVDEVHGRVYIESHRRLSTWLGIGTQGVPHGSTYRVDVSREVSRIRSIFAIRIINGWYIRHETHGRLFFW